MVSDAHQVVLLRSCTCVCVYFTSTALLKAQSTLTFELCAREAAQIFGGLAYTRGGQGEKVERLYREVRRHDAEHSQHASPMHARLER